MEFNEKLLTSIKVFIEDLKNVNKDDEYFAMYSAIVNKIDKSKVKSYINLVTGYDYFFKNNKSMITENVFTNLVSPDISYISGDNKISFNFEKLYNVLSEIEQETVKDHLNKIWYLINYGQQNEEKFLEKVFDDIKTKVDGNKITREDHIVIFTELFNEFKRQSLDFTILVKLTCKKTRELVDPESPVLELISFIEQLDFDNLDKTQLFELINKAALLNDDDDLNSIITTLIPSLNLF